MKRDFCDRVHHFVSTTQSSLWGKCCLTNLFLPLSCTAIARCATSDLPDRSETYSPCFEDRGMSSDLLYGGFYFSGSPLMLWGASLLFQRSVPQTRSPVLRIKPWKIIGFITDHTFQVQFKVFSFSCITSTGQSLQNHNPN